MVPFDVGRRARTVTFDGGGRVEAGGTTLNVLATMDVSVQMDGWIGQIFNSEFRIGIAYFLITEL